MESLGHRGLRATPAGCPLRGSDTVTFAFKVDAPGAAFGRRNAGFSFFGDDLARVDGAGARFEGNVLVGVQAALFGAGAVGRDDRGYGGGSLNLYGEGVRLERNALALSDFGVYSENQSELPQRISRSVFVGNALGAVATSDGQAQFDRCVVAGNARFGADFGPNTTATGLSLFGNGAAPEPLEAANCGRLRRGSA